MGQSLISLVSVLSIFFSCSSFQKNNMVTSNHTDTTSNQLIIKVGSSTFNATLLNNPAVTEFKQRLPLTINMSELNGNEKLYRFSTNLPANASNPGTIQTGDLMLYGSNTLVLFYQTFSTTYSYTRLGRINNPSALATALGSNNGTVTFKVA